MSICKKVVAVAVVVVLPIVALSQETPRQPGEDSLRVARDVLTTGVDDREPIDDATVFPPSVGELFYFTEVQGADTPTQITHVWYYNNDEMARVTLSVDGPRWRTWSSKRILENWIGSWRVETVDADGNVLSSQTFDVH
ncbi:MAG: DUF2914 domain-containing protein [Candidatus Methylomirabilales bacterium]